MVAATKPAAEKSAATKGAKPKAAPSRKRKRAKKQPDPNAKGRRNRELGARGEEAAARFLRRNGYHILERNWSCAATATISSSATGAASPARPISSPSMRRPSSSWR